MVALVVDAQRRSARHSPVRALIGLGILLLFSLLTPQAGAIVPGKPMSNYEQRLWTKADGLSDNSVYDVIQSRDGYLWVLTRLSLARFDGLQFTNFSRPQVFGTPTVPSLNRNITSSLFEDREGRLWVAIGDRVAYFKDGHFTSFTALPSAAALEPAFIIHTIFEDHEGSMWFGTETGLFRYRQGKVTSFGTEDGLTNPRVLAITEDIHNRLWIGTNGGGLNLFENGRFVGVRGRFSSDYVTALLADGETIWIGTVSDGLRSLRNGQFTICTQSEGLAKESIRLLYKDRKGYLWVGTQYEGLRLISPSGEVSAYRKADGFASNRNSSLVEDNEGNFWIGTMSGLIRFRDRIFQTVGPQRSGEELPARTVIQDHQGDFWIGTHTEGLYRIHQGKVSGMQPGLSSNAIRALYVDKDDSLWIGTDPGGLNHLLTNGQITVFTTQQRLAGNVVKSILRARDGDLWVGTDHGGVSRLRNGTFTNFTVRDGLGSNIVLGILQSRDGTLWFATDGGLSKLQNGKFTNLTTKDGLAEDRIRALYEDSEGVLWIGTRNAGFHRLKDGIITHYVGDPSLAGYGVFSILEDNQSNLWLSTLRGLVRVSKQELNDFASGRIHATSSASYGVADGVASEECSSAVQPAGWKGRDGRLWFPTTSGVVVVSPSEIHPDPPPPPVTIGAILFDRRPVPVDASMLELAPGQGDLEFHFSALAFSSPETVRFRYKLEGYDKDWTEAGVQRLAEYTNLPPGTYRFRVLARRSRGPWSQQATEVALQLRPHFYQTYRFYSLCALAAVLSFWLIQRVQRQRLQRRERELSLMEDAMKRRIEAEEQLRQSESRYHDLFESAVYGIYRARPGSYIEVNRAMVAMLGYDSEEEVLALDPASQVYADPEDSARVKKAMETSGRVEALEVTWKRKDGKRITVLLSGRRIPGAQGLADTAEVIAEDITERKHLEEQLRQSQKMEAIGRLAGGIAHDFNNLLTIILGYTRLLLDGDVNRESQSGALRQVERAAQRASELTNQLLAFSRHQIIQSSVHSLNTIVTNMKSMLERVIGEDIELSTELAPDLGLIKGDRSQIEQVIMNLAVNSRDAMPQGGKLRFATRNVVEEEKASSGAGSTRGAKPHVLLEVSDTGTGMDSETLERIFDPFFTTKEKGRGTGLGLSTVYGIIEQAGGRIRAESKVGRGTSFYIYLPQVLEPEAPTVGKQPPVLEMQGTETILLIEDHTALRELTHTMLRANGYTVLQAGGATEAERICREYKRSIDLIVTDVVMPELSGPELAKSLQKLRPGVRLLYTSGYTEDHRLRQEVLENKLPFLQKPFSRSDLLSKVREVLSTPISQTVT